MEHGSLASVVRRLRNAVGRQPSGGNTDARLLDLFVSQRNEAAFELLVWRHERLVRGVCRRLLHCEQDVQDACQATFLTLACKAGSIGTRQALGGWLYKVAYRIALRARTDADKRARCEKEAAERRAQALPDEAALNADRQHLRLVLVEEVSRLPEKYRTTIVLCYVEGKTNAEAASELGCPTGTVVTWLARARKQLRRRLARRGLGVSAGALAGVLAWPDAGAAAPPAFLRTTVQAALLFAQDKTAAGLVTPRVAMLTKGALHTMLMSKMKGVALILAAVCLAVTGPGLLACYLVEPGPTTPNQDAASLQVFEGGTLGPDLEGPAAGKEKKDGKAKDRKDSRQKAEEVINRSFKTGKSPRLSLEVFNGGIEIVADAQGTVDARLTKQSQAATQEQARQALKNIEVKWTQDRDTIRIIARRLKEEKQDNQESVSAVVHVPPGALLDLRTDNGAVQLSAGTGEVRVRTSNGAIRVKDSKGSLRLTTANGAIAVTGARGPMDLKTQNGSITLQGEKVVVKAHTSNSGIRFTGVLADGKHSFSTNNGSIVLTLPANAKFQMDAETTNGTIVNDFSSANVRAHPGHARVQDTVGDNPAVAVQLHTQNGSIQVRKKK
jgi:RNA polymerase sigma factor (sigma-70 family)